MNRSYITVINPKGIKVEIDEARWPELSRKGYKKTGSNFSKPDIISDDEYLEVEEI